MIKFISYFIVIDRIGNKYTNILVDGILGYRA